MKTQQKNDIERFRKFYSQDGPDKCWPWLGAKHSGGYGAFSFKGKPQPASRVSYLLFKGPIPKGIVVRHTCDNRRCVNPNHLILGTQAENVQDAVDRNRFPKGEHRATKLRQKDVEYILTSDLSIYDLAIWFGVSSDYISMIQRGDRWGHVNVANPSRAVLRKRNLPARGEGHHAAKLTPPDIIAIRADSRPQRLIAEEYGVHQVTISEIKRRKIWAHV